MDFLSKCQREALDLWEIISEHEELLISLQTPQLGEHVFIKEGDSPPREAKLLDFNRIIARVMFINDKSHVHRVELKSMMRPGLGLQEKLFRRRIPEIAAHVGCPFGPKQAWHEIRALRKIYKQQKLKKLPLD